MIFRGTFRLPGWWRWLPVYVSPMFGQCPWWRSVCGIAVGTFGRVAYVAWER